MFYAYFFLSHPSIWPYYSIVHEKCTGEAARVIVDSISHVLEISGWRSLRNEIQNGSAALVFFRISKQVSARILCRDSIHVNQKKEVQDDE